MSSDGTQCLKKCSWSERAPTEKGLRWIEELKLALKQNPSHVPLGLTNSCLKSFRFFGWNDICHPPQWQDDRKRALAQLHDLLRRSQSDSLQAWKTKVRSYEGACKWVKRSSPPPWTLTSHLAVTTGRGAGVEHLSQIWKPVFSGPPGYDPHDNHRSFLPYYDKWIPSFPEVPLQKITKEEFQGVIGKMRHKAAGPDGWSPPLLEALPEPAWDCLFFIEWKKLGNGRCHFTVGKSVVFLR